MFLDELLKEQPNIHEKRYLHNEFGCPKVMQETVCDEVGYPKVMEEPAFEEVDLSKFVYPWTRKVADGKN